MLDVSSRRGFLTGLTGFVACAPAIVRASSLMPVKSYDDVAIPIVWGKRPLILGRVISFSINPKNPDVVSMMAEVCTDFPNEYPREYLSFKARNVRPAFGIGEIVMVECGQG